MPVQCPECARFLSKDLVAGLATAPASCPKCATPLTAAMFDGETSVRPPDLPGGGASVRPPDLPATEVRTAGDGARDPLAGWDDPADAHLDRWQRPARGLDPAGLAVVGVGAGALGAGVGALVSPGRRGRGALLGAVVGALGAIAGAQLSRR